jgi:hypothetical protein
VTNAPIDPEVLDEDHTIVARTIKRLRGSQ